MIDEKIKNAVARMSLNDGTTSEALGKLREELAFVFPDDFEGFLLYSNGAQGEIGAEYLELWSAEQISELNQALEIKSYAPGLIAFGSDGANELYAFDTRKPSPAVVQVPMIGLSLDDVWSVAETFSDFLIMKSRSN